MAAAVLPQEAGEEVNGWVLLILAALLEIVWATGLKYTDGLKKPGPTVLVLLAYNAGLVLLAWAVEKIPVGTAYAVWVGIGVVGVAVFGMVKFGEPITTQRVFLLSVIVAAVIGLKLAK